MSGIGNVSFDEISNLWFCIFIVIHIFKNLKTQLTDYYWGNVHKCRPTILAPLPTMSNDIYSITSDFGGLFWTPTYPKIEGY